MAGAGSFSITVTGQNFAPTTTVLWDNTSLTTTYVSPTVLQATVPASLVAKPGTVTLIPSPQVTFNFGANFTISVPPLTGNNSYSVSMVPVAANDIAWDQTSQQLYLAVASGNGTNANTITALNPQTRAFGTSVSTGTQPDKLAVATDGSYIYAGLNSAGSVHRYTLPNLQSDVSIPLGSTVYGPYYALEIQAQPGSAHTVAVARGEPGISPAEQGGIVIYDDAVARAQSVPGASSGTGPIDSLVWNPNGQVLYGIDAQSESDVLMMSVNSSGVQIQSKSPAAGSYLGSHLNFDATTGLLYGDGGQVLDPVTGAVTGNFPLSTIQGGFLTTPIMVPDGKLNIAYFLGQTNYVSTQGTYALEAYDLTRLTFLGAIPLTNVAGTPSRIVRWGTNGLAILTGSASGLGAIGDGVYLVSGAFVTSPAP